MFEVEIVELGPQPSRAVSRQTPVQLQCPKSWQLFAYVS
jgi:hypothetical protein